MTEYDYSPDAYERHLATQEKIARWVDQTLEHTPCNPFELLPSELERPTQNPQPFYAKHQGDTLPTTYSKSRAHEHSQWHSPSQPSTPLIMPQARPQFSRSYSSPPPSAGQYLPSKPYPPYPPYPTTPSRIPSPYTSRYQPSPTPHRSSSQNSFRTVRSPHIRANPAIQQQHGSNTYSYFSPSIIPQPMHQQPQPQPVVVVKGGRVFTVVPSPGQQVQVFSSHGQKTGSKSRKSSRGNRY